MAKFSSKGWSSDLDVSRMTSDQIDRYVDGLRDNMSLRFDHAPRPKRLHESPAYLNSFGSAELIKHDYTLDLQRAKAGDAEARARIRLAEAQGRVPVGITMARELAEARLRQVEAEKIAKEVALSAERKRREEKARAIALVKQRIRECEEGALRAKKAYYEGNLRAAVDVATCLLNHPKLNTQRFEEARDWLNAARNSGIIDLPLLNLFADVCRAGRVPNARQHLERYAQIIAKLT